MLNDDDKIFKTKIIDTPLVYILGVLGANTESKRNLDTLQHILNQFKKEVLYDWNNEQR